MVPFPQNTVSIRRLAQVKKTLELCTELGQIIFSMLQKGKIANLDEGNVQLELCLLFQSFYLAE